MTINGDVVTSHGFPRFFAVGLRECAVSTCVLVPSDPVVGFIVSNPKLPEAEVRFVIRSAGGNFLEFEGTLGASGKALAELIDTSTNANIACESARTLCVAIGLDICTLLGVIGIQSSIYSLQALGAILRMHFTALSVGTDGDVDFSRKFNEAVDGAIAEVNVLRKL
jgi:hypothetical protein